jgi:hypothetical protein
MTTTSAATWSARESRTAVVIYPANGWPTGPVPNENIVGTGSDTGEFIAQSPGFYRRLFGWIGHPGSVASRR